MFQEETKYHNKSHTVGFIIPKLQKNVLEQKQIIKNDIENGPNVEILKCQLWVEAE